MLTLFAVFAMRQLLLNNKISQLKYFITVVKYKAIKHV